MPDGPVAVPTTEIGRVVDGSLWWQVLEYETTPELRWPFSVQVYDKMRRQDAQVASVLRAVTHPVRRTTWRVDPNGARDEVVQLVAEDLGLPIAGGDPVTPRRTRDRFSWIEHLRLALLMLPMGHSYFEQTYRIDAEGRARLRKLGQRPSRTIDTIEVAPDGGLVSLKQHGTEKPIPVTQLVAYVLDREGGNWLGQSVLRTCYKNWLLKDRLLRVQAETIQRNGMGVPLYKAAEGEPSLADGTALAKAWRSGDAAGAAVPNGADLILRGVEGDLPDAEPAIRYHDEQIARAVLAHFLNLGTQTGSWALGTTFADFFTLSLQSVAQEIADTATQHIVEDLVDLNWGEDEPAPKIVFDEIGSRHPATAESIKSLIDAGVLTPDDAVEQQVRNAYGLPQAEAKPEGESPASARQLVEMVQKVYLGVGTLGDPNVVLTTEEARDILNRAGANLDPVEVPEEDDAPDAPDDAESEVDPSPEGADVALSTDPAVAAAQRQAWRDSARPQWLEPGVERSNTDVTS